MRSLDRGHASFLEARDLGLRKVLEPEVGERWATPQ